MQSERGSGVSTFFELVVWKKAHALVLGIYRLTAQFPKHEWYGLTNQMRRAAVSIPANIVEGFKRRGKMDKLRFMNMAQSSLEEVRYYLIVSKDLEYAKIDSLGNDLDETGRLLAGYMTGIEKAFK